MKMWLEKRMRHFRKRCIVKKFLLGTALALLTLGSISVPSAEAHPWRWGAGYYAAPYASYYPGYSYYGPGWGGYYGPRVFVGVGGWRWR